MSKGHKNYILDDKLTIDKQQEFPLNSLVEMAKRQMADIRGVPVDQLSGIRSGVTGELIDMSNGDVMDKDEKVLDENGWSKGS